MSDTVKLLLAPFVLYALLSGGLGFAFATLVERVLRLTARTRAILYAGVLLLPFATYASYLSHMRRGCSASSSLSARLCVFSARYADFLAPTTILLLGLYVVYRLYASYSSPLRRWSKPSSEIYRMRVQKLLPNNLIDIEIRHSEYPSAFLRGYRSPVLVITTGLVDLLDDQELAGVIAHEVAHLKHHDNYLNWVFLLRELTFFSPFAQYAYSAYLDAREQAADNLAAAGNEEQRLALASALIKVIKRAEQLTAFSRIAVINSALTSQRGITRRVELLVLGGEANYTRLSPVVPLVFILALAMLIC